VESRLKDEHYESSALKAEESRGKDQRQTGAAIEATSTSKRSETSTTNITACKMRSVIASSMEQNARKEEEGLADTPDRRPASQTGRGEENCCQREAKLDRGGKTHKKKTIGGKLAVDKTIERGSEKGGIARERSPLKLGGKDAEGKLPITFRCGEKKFE